MSLLLKSFTNIWSKKYWHNEGTFCDRKHHTRGYSLGYRPYRRGKNRCVECGAKIGKPKLERYAHRDKMIDNIYSGNPLLEMLKAKGNYHPIG